MMRRLLPALLLLSACEGSIPTRPDGDTNTTVTESSYLSRDPVMSGSKIVQFQAIDDSHVLVLDGTHTLYYTSFGATVTSQTVQTNVGWFVASPESRTYPYPPTIWIKDLQNNLYQWQLGWAPNGGVGTIVAYGVGQVKVTYYGYPYWNKNGALYTYGSYGGIDIATIDPANVRDFFPADYGWTFDLGTDGKLWSWGYDSIHNQWSRQYIDGNAIAAQPGCFNNVNGACNSYVLGSDHKLWLESNEYGGHGSNPVDSNVYNFFGTDAHIVFVEHLDGNLYREDVRGGTPDWVDGNVSRFQPAGNYTVWVQGTDGKLWREHLSTTLP